MAEPTASNYVGGAALDNNTSLGADQINIKSFTLGANVGSADTTIPASATITGITAPFYLLADSELMYVEGISGANFTPVVRGVGGTTAASHTSGITLFAVYAANLFNQLKRAIIAIETELGIAPSGNYADVTARFASLPAPPGGRLTLTTGTPVTTSDVTGATSVFYAPYVHNLIQLWNGTYWEVVSFSETTLAIGTVTSGLPHDVFGFLSAGVLTLEKLAWTNGTTRATDISLQDGRYCKTGDKTRLYLGTFYTTSTTTTEDSGGGVTTQVGGKRFLFNMYNRVLRPLAVIDTTDTWSYTVDTIRQANGAAGNKVEFIVGVKDNAIQANVFAVAGLISNTRSAKVGVGLDTITAFSGLAQQAFNATASTFNFPMGGSLKTIPAIGYHYISWNEKGSDGTNTWLGDNAGVMQSGLIAEIWA